MYSIFKHTQRLTPEPKSCNSISKDTASLSRRAHQRLHDWTYANEQLIKTVFGSIHHQKAVHKLEKIHMTPKKNQTIPLENPYFETKFAENLRKTHKSKNLAHDFIRIQYTTEKERISLSTSRNLSIDSNNSRISSPNPRIIQKINAIKKPLSPVQKKPFVPDPFSDQNYEGMFRKRKRSLEIGKNFFVTTKIQTPESNFLNESLIFE